MSIGLSIANKLKRELEEADKVTTETSSNKNDDKEKRETQDNQYEVNFPQELGLNLDSTDPVGELAKIDEFYKQQREKANKQPIVLDRVEVPNESEEDVLYAVKQSVDNKYNKERNKTLEEYANIKEIKESQKESAKLKQKESEDKINLYYDEADQTVQNNVLRRGLARSSIAVLELDGLTKERANALSKTAQDLTDELNRLDDEILSLEAKKENALISLDIDWATELNNEIIKRQEELKDKQKQAIEFNNNVTKLENELNLKQEKQDNDIMIKNINNGIYDENYIANSNSSKGEEAVYKINYILNYLNKLPKAEALKKLTTDNMIAYYLGDAFSGVYYTQAQRKN